MFKIYTKEEKKTVTSNIHWVYFQPMSIMYNAMVVKTTGLIG